MLRDLKQFIEATISQQLTSQTSELREEFSELKANFVRLEKKVDEVDARLGGKLDNLTDFVTDAIDTANESADAQLKDHEHRITRLEHNTATN